MKIYSKMEINTGIVSHLQSQMPFDGLLDLLLLDADIPLCHGGGGVLQELLDQSDVVVAVPVYLCVVELAEAVGADACIAQIVTNQLQLLLNSSGGDGEDQLMGRNLIVQTVAADVLIEGERDGESPGLLGLLLHDGQAVSSSILHDIHEPQFGDIGNPQSQVSLQDQSCGNSRVGTASCKALLHGVNDLLILFLGQGDSFLVHENDLLKLLEIRAKSELSAGKSRTLRVYSDKPLGMLHLGIRISRLLRTERKSSPCLALHPGRGSGLLFTVQEDAEKEQNGQLDCQHDPLQAHHGEPSSLKITSKFCLRSLLERG